MASVQIFCPTSQMVTKISKSKHTLTAKELQKKAKSEASSVYSYSSQESDVPKKREPRTICIAKKNQISAEQIIIVLIVTLAKARAVPLQTWLSSCAVSI